MPSPQSGEGVAAVRLELPQNTLAERLAAAHVFPLAGAFERSSRRMRPNAQRLYAEARWNRETCRWESLAAAGTSSETGR